MDLIAEWSWFLKLNCSPDGIAAKGVLRLVTLFSVAKPCHLVLWEILVLQDVRGSKPFQTAARMAIWMDEDAPVACLSIYCYD